MSIAERIEPKKTISTEEMENRRQIVREAIASNRIEGADHTADLDPILEDYICGALDHHELLPRLNEVRSQRRD